MVAQCIAIEVIEGMCVNVSIKVFTQPVSSIENYRWIVIPSDGNETFTLLTTHAWIHRPAIKRLNNLNNYSCYFEFPSKKLDRNAIFIWIKISLDAL